MLTKRVKNNTGSAKTYLGQEIAPAAYYQIQSHEEVAWAVDATLIADVNAGTAVINNGTTDLGISDGLKLLQAVNASHLGDVEVDATTFGDQKKMIYDQASGKLKFVAESPGSAAGGAGEVQFRGLQAGVFAASSQLSFDSINNSLGIGNAKKNLKNNPLGLSGNINDYVQYNISNASTGNAASADVVATSDVGGENSGYIDVGINNSGYNQAAYSSGGPGDSYVLANGGDLAIITETTGKQVGIFTGGASSDKQRLIVDANGNIVPGLAALATNATNGFVFIQSCAGIPTGTPASYTGRVPLVWDSVNNAIYGYSGGQWRQVSGGGGGGQERVVPIYLPNGGGHVHASYLTFDEIYGLMRGTIANVVRESSSDGGHTHTLTMVWNASKLAVTATIGQNHNHVFSTFPPSPFLAEIQLFSNSASYLQVTSTNYVSLCKVYYPGLNEGNINTIKAVVQMAGGTSMAVKIQDVTNNATIAELTGITNNQFAIVNLGTVANLPLNEAILEVQVKGQGGSPIARISSVSLKG